MYIDFTRIADSNYSNCMVTSKMRSHIDYLIQTYNILVLILYPKGKIIAKCSRTGDLMMILDSSFLGHPVVMSK